MGDVVDDADGELRLGTVGREVVEDGDDHRRGEFLRRQAVAAAGDGGRSEFGPVGPMLGERGDHVLVEGFAGGARFLGPVEHGDARHRGGQRRHEPGGVEGSVEADVDQADPLAAGDEAIDGVAHGGGTRSHHDHDAVGVGVAVILERGVGPTGEGRQAVHLGDHDVGNGGDQRVGGLAALEEHVGVLGGAPDDGPVGVEGPGPVPGDRVEVDHRGDRGVVDGGDRVDLVAGAESVEEVQERHPALEGRGVGHEGEVVGFLHRSGGQHGHPGLAARHHVAVVAEDAERVGGDRTGGHVDHRRQVLAGDLVEVRDHQQQALRRGERRGERSAEEGAVEGAGGTGLGLHLDHVGHVAPQIGAAGVAPCVRQLTHRRRRSDRIDGDDLAQLVSDPGGSLVAVDDHEVDRAAGLVGCGVGHPVGSGAGGGRAFDDAHRSTRPDTSSASTRIQIGRHCSFDHGTSPMFSSCSFSAQPVTSRAVPRTTTLHPE